MSQVVRKPVFGVATNRTVQPLKMSRGLKFRIYEVEELYYLCSENKGADQLRDYSCAAVIAQLICDFVLAYANSRFSYDAAHSMI